MFLSLLKVLGQLLIGAQKSQDRSSFGGLYRLIFKGTLMQI